ncbi:iron complex outermembrane recepter protein [Sphingomonas sp. F9_3S_D5_B_2]
MRRARNILLSTSALAAFGFVGSPAVAQDQTVTPTNPAATAQQSPADPQPNADAPQSPAAAAGNGTDQGSIVVTGLRRSLQSARNIKRNSDQIVDAIVAEDIGKLPDITVSDTAARIPGIQVERAGGEANRVLLRGLDNVYYTTTYNSRELFTAETRSVALQDFPAGAIASVEAFKTSTANLIEPGIAGLVNVRSRRPFDFKGLEVAGSVWGVFPNQSRDNSVNGQLLLSDRWRAGEGEFGALINFSYTRMHYQDSVRRHGFFIADLAGGRSPDYPEIHYNEGNRWRPSINGALQYRIGGLQLYAEGLWQGYRERQLDSMWAQPLWGGASYDNLAFRDGTNEIISGTVHTPGACCGTDSDAWGFKGSTHRETNTYQFAAGGSYDAGPLRISADLAHTSSHFKLRTESIDYQIGTHDYDVNWYTGEPGGSGPTFEVVGLDPTDPSNYQYRGFFEDYSDPKGKDWQGRVDFEYDPHLNFIPKIQWGVRYVDRKASDRGGSFYWNLRNANIPISDVPLDYELLHPAFRGDNHRPFPFTWLAPTYSSLWDDLQGFRQWNIDQSGVGSVDGPPIDPARSYNINERSYAAYGQVNFKFDAGPAAIDGIIGLRAVKTKQNIQGTLVQTAVTTPLDYSNTFTDWLPNANLNVRFSRAWQVRLAATKTRTRPRFQDLNPALVLDQANTGCDPTQTNCVRTGRGGNPFLKPFKSSNYDASLEYYFSPTGFASAGVFHRDIKGFIANQTILYPDLDPETGFPLEIRGPVNTDKGKIDGFEAQVRTFFDFGFVPSWARSFGVEANVTHIKAKAVFRVLGNPETFLSEPLPDVSKWSYNLTGMYERGPLSIRLSYNWRGRYPEGGLADNGLYTLQGLAKPSPRLDLSTSYTLSDSLTFFADWTNILNHPFRSDIVRTNYDLSGSVTSTERFPMVVRYEERVISAGVRFRFGGSSPAPVASAPMMLPPPPAREPAPAVEQPAPPPPPPPPASSGERGQ